MKLIPYLALLALPLAISSAYAADPTDGPTVTISGFGTAALTRSNTDDAEFARVGQLAGVKSSAKTGVDSNFGIQATAKMNDWLSLTGQGLVSKHITDEYGAELSWAFAKFKASDKLSIRVGRMGLPVYMISDYLNVGYSNTYLRPPVEMYSQVNLQNVDGIDAIYQTSFGESTLTSQVAFGKSETKGNGNAYTVKFTTIAGINLVLENGPFTARFGHITTKFNVDDSASLNAVVGGLRKYGFQSAADSLKIHDNKASFTSLGLGVDWKNWIVQSEYGVRKSESLSLPDTTSWYTMLGYRVGKFTPYYHHASVKQDSPRTVAGLPTTGPLAALTAGANTFASLASIQTSNSIGLRWDFSKSADLKLQLDRFSPESGPGTFINAKPGFKGPVTVFAAAVDFVF
ncbi:porin [Undibacterium sp. Jales W-56]|uniref:porin n=1 Tax=Undibacterium sp. Jales W-56 TaxID=2897325 RepID=UPI0021D1A596|nr:porin [Undibacterium sp. Jales W-56]MCU6434886.1 porin [Undibacterium sp. Jales W-56]